MKDAPLWLCPRKADAPPAQARTIAGKAGRLLEVQEAHHAPAPREPKPARPKRRRRPASIPPSHAMR